MGGACAHAGLWGAQEPRQLICQQQVILAVRVNAYRELTRIDPAVRPAWNVNGQDRYGRGAQPVHDETPVRLR